MPRCYLLVGDGLTRVDVIDLDSQCEARRLGHVFSLGKIEKRAIAVSLRSIKETFRLASRCASTTAANVLIVSADAGREIVEFDDIARGERDRAFHQLFL